MKRQFAILTDSGSDLPAAYYEEHGVEHVPMGFTMDGVTYGGEEGETIEVKRFYELLRGGSMPKTFQISPEQAKLHMEPHVRAGEDVLVISFSSGLSGTYQSYVIAARELSERYPSRKIFVVDSLCASLGEGLLVDYVVKKADSGASIEETRDYAERLKGSVCHFFTVDNLYHLKRGGRVSATTAFVGTMLQIKPVLHVDDEGKLVAIGKAMGRKKSISALVERMKQTATLGADDPIFVSHGDCAEDAEYAIKLVKAAFGEREIFMSEIGAVIGTHSGAGTLALFFLGSKR